MQSQTAADKLEMVKIVLQVLHCDRERFVRIKAANIVIACTILLFLPPFSHALS